MQIRLQVLKNMWHWGHIPLVQGDRLKNKNLPLGLTCYCAKFGGCIITRGVGVEFNASSNTIYIISEAIFRANHLTDTDKQNSAGKHTNWIQLSKQCKVKLPWFSCLLWLLARKRDGLILQRSRVHRSNCRQKNVPFWETSSQERWVPNI